MAARSVQLECEAMYCSCWVGQGRWGAAGHCCDHVNRSVHQANCDQDQDPAERSPQAAGDRRADLDQEGSGGCREKGKGNKEWISQ